MIEITTYDELTRFVSAFGAGHFNTLVICSEGGLGKTETARKALEGHVVVRIRGHVTPLKLYSLLHDGRDRPVLLDELDELLGDARHVALLKQLCETRESKRIAWASADRRAAEIDGGRGYFDTRSHVLMLCNSFSILNANVSALKTRATLVRFVPSPAEILAKIRTFAGDHDIIAFLDEFHEALPEFNLRTYRRLEDLKRAGLDWQRYTLAETNVPPKVKEIADLLVKYDTDTKRIEHHSGSRRDYYNWKPEAEAYLRRRNIMQSRQKLRLVEAPFDQAGRLRAVE